MWRADAGVSLAQAHVTSFIFQDNVAVPRSRKSLIRDERFYDATEPTESTEDGTTEARRYRGQINPFRFSRTHSLRRGFFSIKILGRNSQDVIRSDPFSVSPCL